MYPWEALLLLAKFNSLRKGGRATRLPFVVGEGDSYLRNVIGARNEAPWFCGTQSLRVAATAETTKKIMACYGEHDAT